MKIKSKILYCPPVQVYRRESANLGHHWGFRLLTLVYCLVGRGHHFSRSRNQHYAFLDVVDVVFPDVDKYKIWAGRPRGPGVQSGRTGGRFWGNPQVFLLFFFILGEPSGGFCFLFSSFSFHLPYFSLLEIVSFIAFIFSVSSLGSASWLSGTSCWLPCHGFKYWQERFLTKLSASLERIDMHKKTHEREFACGDFKKKMTSWE